MSLKDKFSFVREMLRAGWNTPSDKPVIQEMTQYGASIIKQQNITTAYRGAKQANGSAGIIKYETVPPDVTRVKLINKNSTTGDNLLHSFGIDDTDAGANMTAGADVVLSGDKDFFDIPVASQNGGAFAYRSESANTINFHLSWLK